MIEKIRIQQAKLSTQLKLDISNDSAGDEHECDLLTHEECEIFDNLEAIEESVGSDVVEANVSSKNLLSVRGIKGRVSRAVYSNLGALDKDFQKINVQ